MSVKEQFEHYNRLWGTTNDYEEALSYADNPDYVVQNTYHANGLFDTYYIHLK